MAAAIAGCVMPPSRSSTIWMRSRCVDGSFHRSAVRSRRTSALLHLTICSSRIRWPQRITPQIPKTTPPSTAFSGNKYADSCCSGAGMTYPSGAGYFTLGGVSFVMNGTDLNFYYYNGQYAITPVNSLGEGGVYTGAVTEAAAPGPIPGTGFLSLASLSLAG